MARILEDDVKYWEQNLGVDVSQPKKKQAAKTVEDASLGKRKLPVEEQQPNKNKESEEVYNITMEDLIFMLRVNQKYANTDLVVKAHTSSLIE